MGLRIVGIPVAICTLLAMMALSVSAAAGANAPADGRASVGLPSASVSLSHAGGLHTLERVQRQIVRDRDRALLGGGRLKLGALSDGYFDVRIREPQAKVVVLIPPLRARHLEQTRELAKRRYGETVMVRLARLHKPRRMRPPAVAPRSGKPLSCPAQAGRSPVGSWNAKQIVGMPLRPVERVATRHGCSVQVVVIDGMALSVPGNLSYSRVNVVVRAGKVTRILGIA